jgi:hypothetical protein
MIAFVRNFVFACVIGFAANWTSDQVGSDFLRQFLKGNLVTILIALTAINATTASIVLTQLREMLDRQKKGSEHFDRTISELRLSFVEQMLLVLLAIVGETAAASSKLTVIFPQGLWIGQTIATGTFAYGLYITFDTARAIFVLLQFRFAK